MKLVNADMLHLIAGGNDEEAAVVETASYTVEVDITFEEVTVNGHDVLAPSDVSVHITESI